MQTIDLEDSHSLANSPEAFVGSLKHDGPFSQMYVTAGCLSVSLCGRMLLDLLAIATALRSMKVSTLLHGALVVVCFWTC